VGAGLMKSPADMWNCMSSRVGAALAGVSALGASVAQSLPQGAGDIGPYYLGVTSAIINQRSEIRFPRRSGNAGVTASGYRSRGLVPAVALRELKTARTGNLFSANGAAFISKPGAAPEDYGNLKGSSPATAGRFTSGSSSNPLPLI
jgi:hypothetical protein